MTPFEFIKICGIRRLESLGIKRHRLRDPTFSHFGTILACNRQMDRQTDKWTYGHSIHCTSI